MNTAPTTTTTPSLAPTTSNPPEFARVDASGDFFQSTAFFPMPVIIVVSQDSAGQLNVAPYSLCFPQPEAGEGMLMLISRRPSNTARNIAATGKASLCFLPDDRRLLDHCVTLGHPAPSEEKMQRSQFTMVTIGDRPMIAEAEQVFSCSLRDLTIDDQGKEHRMLLHVDDVWLKPRWLRALKRGWGAPRLAVEFGFRGRSARWLSRPRVDFGGPALRPTFEMEVNMSVEEVVESLQRALDARHVAMEGFVRSGKAQINIPKAEATFWSPELTISIDADGKRALLHGRIGPHAQVWTLFLLCHAAVAILGGFGALAGVSQWLIDQTPWALWALPAALVVHGLLLGATFIGQGLGAEHVFRLREFVDEALTH